MRVIVSGILGALAIATGAFGAHALREQLAPNLLAVWQTAASYHLTHAVVLLALALFERASGRSVLLPWSLLLAGVALFSGSLYAMALTGFRPLGMVTPLGGILMIAGWVAIALVLRS